MNIYRTVCYSAEHEDFSVPAAGLRPSNAVCFDAATVPKTASVFASFSFCDSHERRFLLRVSVRVSSVGCVSVCAIQVSDIQQSVAISSGDLGTQISAVRFQLVRVCFHCCVICCCCGWCIHTSSPSSKFFIILRQPRFKVLRFCDGCGRCASICVCLSAVLKHTP